METDVGKEASNTQSMRIIFLVMALVGGIMALLPAITPFYHAQFWPALIVAICALVFFMWGGAGKGIKTALAVVTLLGGLWILINIVVGIVEPPIGDIDLAEVLAGDLRALIPLGNVLAVYALGAIGGLVAFLGSIFGIFSARG